MTDDEWNRLASYCEAKDWDKAWRLIRPQPLNKIGVDVLYVLNAGLMAKDYDNMILDLYKVHLIPSLCECVFDKLPLGTFCGTCKGAQLVPPSEEQKKLKKAVHLLSNIVKIF